MSFQWVGPGQALIQCNVPSPSPGVMTDSTEYFATLFSMKKSTKFLLTALLCGAPLLASAQVGIGIGVNLGGVVREGPPPPRVESYGPAPAGPGWFWIGGHWARHHGRWIWVGGRWDRHVGYAWSPGHWDQTGSGWLCLGRRPVGGSAAPAAPGGLCPASAGRRLRRACARRGDRRAGRSPRAHRRGLWSVAPGPDFFWIGGHWGWRGGRWVWTHGRYERHPHWHPGAGWVEGHWDRRGGGYVWVEGHWR